MASAVQLNSDVVQQLLEAGYLAAGRGLAGLADQIFAGVESARPDSAAPAIGRAVAAMNAGAGADAVDVLQSALKARPDDDVLKSFLAVALRMAGMNQQSEQVAREVQASGRDPHASALAQALLNPADE